MLMGKVIDAREIPASSRSGGPSKYAGFIAAALKLPVGKAQSVEFSENDRKVKLGKKGAYPTNALVAHINRRDEKDLSATSRGGKVVYITRLK